MLQVVIMIDTKPKIDKNSPDYILEFFVVNPILSDLTILCRLGLQN